MTDLTSAVEDDLRRIADAQQRFVAAITRLVDSDVRRPSALPGWTIGHVLTHVARNADSHRRRAEAAARGEVVEQYPGGRAGRAAEIDQGAGRPAEELIEDIRRSAAEMDAAWRAVPAERWAIRSPDVSGTDRRLDELPRRRWQEIEVHLVDLDVGVTYRQWPEEFVAVQLPILRPSLPGRLPAGAGPPPPGVLDGHDELAWLYGRLRRPDLPELNSWD